LLTQGDNLQPEVMSRAEEAGKLPEETQGKPKHWGKVYNCWWSWVWKVQ